MLTVRGGRHVLSYEYWHCNSEQYNLTVVFLFILLTEE